MIVLCCILIFCSVSISYNYSVYGMISEDSYSENDRRHEELPQKHGRWEPEECESFVKCTSYPTQSMICSEIIGNKSRKTSAPELLNKFAPMLKSTSSRSKGKSKSRGGRSARRKMFPPKWKIG